MLLWQNVGAKSTITKGVITMDHVHSTTTEHQKTLNPSQRLGFTTMHSKWSLYLVRHEGLEPPTFAFVVRDSIQLS